MKPTVYLAGPITGLSYNGCTDWRTDTIARLNDINIVGLSPMRSKHYLADRTTIADCYDTVLSNQRGIFARDSWDCRRCDAVLVNLLGSERVSIGTVMEIAWASEHRKPIVLVMESGNIHDHAMLREACPFIVSTLDDGIEIIAALFVQ